jgi:AraC family transcriptional regulator
MPRQARRPPTIADRGAVLIARAVAHIDAHLDAPLDAPTLADRAAMSRHHFHRMFRAYVGCSVGSYVTWRRLQRACALLTSGREPVLEIALAVGYESAQALAKAMRRELGATPTAVRQGDTAPWSNLMSPERLPLPTSPVEGDPAMEPTRHTVLPEGIVALTATARGMVDRTMSRAAQQAYGELVPAIERAGQMSGVRSMISLCPDDPQGPDDPHCRFIAGAVFGHDLVSGEGRCLQPKLPLDGTLAWTPLSPGRYAVFTHRGSYSTLYQTWDAIYRQWLPASGAGLRDAAPLEVCITCPGPVPEDELHTEIWIPVA